MSNNDKNIYCSFCGKPQEYVGRLIKGNGSYICDQCVDLCVNILEESDVDIQSPEEDVKDTSMEIPQL